MAIGNWQLATGDPSTGLRTGGERRRGHNLSRRSVAKTEGHKERRDDAAMPQAPNPGRGSGTFSAQKTRLLEALLRYFARGLTAGTGEKQMKPPEKRHDLPEPKNWYRLIGPGAIMVATSLGSGTRSSGNWQLATGNWRRRRQNRRSLLRSSSYEGQAATCESGAEPPHSKMLIPLSSPFPLQCFPAGGGPAAVYSACPPKPRRRRVVEKNRCRRP